MPRNRDEMELLGFLPPRAGEDPRTSDPIDIVDNGAFRDIENLEQDFRDPLDVEANPFLPQVTDNDGAPGYRPYTDASNHFTEEDLDLSSDGDLAAETQPSSDEETDDDLASIVSQREVAAIGSDGRPVSDFKMLQRADAVRNQQIAERAKYVRVNPESAYTGLLGGQVEIPANSADQQMVINWVGEDVEATPVTISLYPTETFSPYPTALTALPLGIATVRWGTRNGTQEAVIDIGTGCQFTINASSVYVSVGHAITPLGVANNAPIRLNASLGFYTCQKNSPLTYTSYIFNTGTTQSCARPPYASHVYFDRANTTVQWTLDFHFSTSGVAYSRIVAANAYLTEPIKLANDICGVYLTNAGAAAMARLTWGLYL